jgi:alpha-L-fucosidase
VEEISAWMKINSEAIYGTRPWTVFGEGPAIQNAAPLSAQGFNEGKGKPFTAEDIRFTVKGNVLYAFLLGWPGENEARIESLGYISKLINGKKIGKVSLLGYKGELVWQQLADYLGVKMPLSAPGDHAVVLKIEGLI